jgi:hypothetical protein
MEIMEDIDGYLEKHLMVIETPKLNTITLNKGPPPILIPIQINNQKILVIQGNLVSDY